MSNLSGSQDDGEVSMNSPGDHIVRAAVYAQGGRVTDIALEEAGDWMNYPDHFVWIGMHEPNEAALRLLQRQFALHDLAVEDALHAHQRPKAERYGETLFLVARTADLVGGRLCIGETHVFAGKGFVVTVRHGPSPSYAQVRERCEATPGLLHHGEDFVLYAILDKIVDHYFPILDALEPEVNALEELLIRCPPSVQHIERIYQLRRDLAALRRAVAPLMEVCSRLERLSFPMIDAPMHPYYRDVHDHVIRLSESIETLREILTFAFEAGMMVATSRQSDTTRRLAAWAAMLAIPTAIAGIYGMNFEFMPELTWRYSYFVLLGVMALLEVVLFRRFRRLGWL